MIDFLKIAAAAPFLISAPLSATAASFSAFAFADVGLTSAIFADTGQNALGSVYADIEDWGQWYDEPPYTFVQQTWELWDDSDPYRAASLTFGSGAATSTTEYAEAMSGNSDREMLVLNLTSLYCAAPCGVAIDLTFAYSVRVSAVATSGSYAEARAGIHIAKSTNGDGGGWPAQSPGNIIDPYDQVLRVGGNTGKSVDAVNGIFTVRLDAGHSLVARGSTNIEGEAEFPVPAVPLPAGLPLMAGSLVMFGLIARFSASSVSGL